MLNLPTFVDDWHLLYIFHVFRKNLQGGNMDRRQNWFYQVVFAVSLVSSLVLFQACASQTQAEKNVNAQVEQQSGVRTPAQATDQGREEILKSRNLNEQQKHEFLKLLDQTQNRVSALKEDCAKLKAALLDQFSKGNYDSKEIVVYKSKMAKNDKAKRDTIFDSLEEARKILGVEARNPAVLHAFHERFDGEI
jgi:hypothetical protein